MHFLHVAPVLVAIDRPPVSRSRRPAPLFPLLSVPRLPFLPPSKCFITSYNVEELQRSPPTPFSFILSIPPPLTPIHPRGFVLPAVHARRGRSCGSKEAAQAEKKSVKGGFAPPSRGESDCLVELLRLLLSRRGTLGRGFRNKIKI